MNSNVKEFINNLYLSDEYIIKNPSLHEEDSPWKFGKIIPFVDKFMTYSNTTKINLLDVGGGAGLILNATSTYIEKKYDIKVNKFAIDLSLGMLEIQKRKNPDLIKALNEDICNTTLTDKEIDLTLMIDVLEHVLNPIEALEEIKRISKFVIFKIPLENNLLSNTINLIKKRKPRKVLLEQFGHVNVYNFNRVKKDLSRYTGQIIDFCYTDAFKYLLNSEYHNKKLNHKEKLINIVAANLFKVSHQLCSLIFNDFLIALVKCY